MGRKKYGEESDVSEPDVIEYDDSHNPIIEPAIVENPKKIKNSEIKKKAVRRTFDLNRGCWIETEV